MIVSEIIRKKSEKSEKVPKSGLLTRISQNPEGFKRISTHRFSFGIILRRRAKYESVPSSRLEVHMGETGVLLYIREYNGKSAVWGSEQGV